MAFTYTPEDGTGLSNANAYFPLATIETELENIVSDDWDKNDEGDKQLLGVKVTRFFEERFRFYGNTLTETQALLWPRTRNFDNRGVEIPAGEMPKQLLTAFSLMCKEAAEDESILDFDTLDRAGELKSWSTDGLSVDFGSQSNSSGRNADDAVKDQLYGTKFTQIEVLLRSIGEIKGVDWVTTNRQTEVR